MPERVERPWFQYLPSRTVDVLCSGAVHRVRWNDGDLELLDHDMEAEQALGALGGESFRCREILDTWSEAADAQRISMWRLQGLPAAGPDLGRVPDEPHESIGLPGPLRVLSTLAAVAELDRRWDDPELLKSTRDALGRFTTERLHAAADESMEATREQRRRMRIRIRTQPVTSTTRMEIAAEAMPGQLVLKVVLPISWMIEVWGRGAAVVEDRLILALAPVDGAESDLRQLGGWAIRWDVVSRNVLIPRVEAVGLEETDSGWALTPDAPRPEIAEPWCSVRTRTVR